MLRLILRRGRPISNIFGAKAYANILSPKPEQTIIFFSPRKEGSIFFVICFLHTSRQYCFDLDTETTHGQPASCRARPVNIDDLQNSKRIHFLGGERLPVMSYAFCPNLKKCLFFAIGDGSRFLSSVFYTPAAKCFLRRAPRITGLHVNELFDPRVGRSP